MFSQKQRLLTAAVIASLSLTACGKKQDLYTPPADSKPPVKTDEGAKKSSTKKKSETDPAKPRSSKPNANIPEPDLGEAEDGRTGQLPEPGAPTEKNPYGTPNNGSTGSGRKSSTNGGSLTPPAPTPRDKGRDNSDDRADRGRSEPPAPRNDDLGLRPFEPIEANDKSFTGGDASDGFSYTGSSPDALLEFLRARNNRVDADTRRKNIELAQSVKSASLTNRDGAAILTLKLSENGQSRNYTLVGDVRAGAATKLELRSTDGSKAADGTLKCMDADGGCENIFARLRIGTPGSADILNVVFRGSGANLFFDLAGNRTASNEYLTLREFMRNTVSKTGDRITYSKISSWEVVNGRAGFNVTMKGNNGQTLAYGGWLVAVSEGSSAALNQSLDNEARSEYASWINGARLIANDTHGRLQIRLSVSTGERFVIKFTRQVKPLVDLSDDNLR